MGRSSRQESLHLVQFLFPILLPSHLRGNWNLATITNSDAGAATMGEFFGTTNNLANQFDCVNWTCSNFLPPAHCRSLQMGLARYVRAIQVSVTGIVVTMIV